MLAGTVRRKVEAVVRRAELMGAAGAEDALAAVLAAPLLHDVGKACARYQESTEPSGERCNAKFPYHEVVSASILSAAITEDTELRRLLGGERLAPVVVYAVLAHHQAMQGRSLEVLHEDPEILARKLRGWCGELLLSELSAALTATIERLRSCALPTVAGRQPLSRLERVLERFSKTAGRIDVDLNKETLNLYISFTHKEGGSDILRRITADSEILPLAYVASGTTMLADSIAASAERDEGLSGFPARVLKEMREAGSIIERLRCCWFR